MRYWVIRVGPTRRPDELEHECPAVSARPLGDDVGNDATIVGGAELQGPVDSMRQVDAVHPEVA